MARAAEDYLTAWHGRHANATHVFAGMRDDAGCTSYERLAALVAPHHVVLDVACGGGDLLALLPGETSPRFRLGVDICEPELALGAARLPAVGFTRARAQALPFADQSVDAVLCHMALMLMDDPDAVLEESRRVLRQGGVFGPSPIAHRHRTLLPGWCWAHCETRCAMGIPLAGRRRWGIRVHTTLPR